METGDLHAAVRRADRCLDRSTADRKNEIKALSWLEEELPTLIDILALDDALQQRHVGLVQAQRKAQLIDAALRAGDGLTLLIERRPDGDYFRTRHFFHAFPDAQMACERLLALFSCYRDACPQ